MLLAAAYNGPLYLVYWMFLRGERMKPTLFIHHWKWLQCKQYNSWLSVIFGDKEFDIWLKLFAFPCDDYHSVVLLCAQMFSPFWVRKQNISVSVIRDIQFHVIFSLSLFSKHLIFVYTHFLFQILVRFQTHLPKVSVTKYHHMYNCFIGLLHRVYNFAVFTSTYAVVYSTADMATLYVVWRGMFVK